MNKLQIKAIGKSKQDISQKRGKLFEELITTLLKHLGYEIEGKPNVNYSGMEIDIEGRAIANRIPLYAECKCYEDPIDAPHLVKFYGKYMALWRKGPRCQSIFIALPCLNSHAKGFYKDNCEEQTDISIVLYEEEKIIEMLIHCGLINNYKNYQLAIKPEWGGLGDYYYMYCEKGFFFVQFLLKKGSVLPTSLVVFSCNCELVTDEKSIELIKELNPDLMEYVLVNEIQKLSQIRIQDKISDHIVEVRASTECFEYQFPAAPKFFIGRNTEISELKHFVQNVLLNNVTPRGILLEANSGWGKSSLVLYLINVLKKNQQYAVAIDSRSASSSQFILQSFYHAFKKYENELKVTKDEDLVITGFNGLMKLICQIDLKLKAEKKVLIIFLDQFENLFVSRDRLKPISDLLLFLNDKQINIILGFSWKTDFVGMMNEFPYDLRDNIINSSKRFSLNTFTQIETNTLLKKLSKEINSSLREDLKFLLSEFSQGYPWLLKKLCAHVKNQKEKGIGQTQIADNLLNVEQLFKEDIEGLSSAEISALRKIAKQAPIESSIINEEINLQLLQSLLSRRLIVYVAHKVDIYWDIFKDYLNTGEIPIQENYILRVFVNQIDKAIKRLVDSKKSIRKEEFQNYLSLGEKSYYNLMRDMKLLGLVKYHENSVALDIKNITKDNYDSFIKSYLNDKLRKNRIIKLIIENVNQNDSLAIAELSKVLLAACPYIAATSKTWHTYAKIFSDWLDFADLAIYNRKNNELLKYQPSSELREKRGVRGRSRNILSIPFTQFEPVNQVLLRIIDAIQKQTKIDIQGIKFSTYKKAVATLDDFGLIERLPGKIRVLFKNYSEMKDESFRKNLLAEKFLSLESSKKFITILDKYSNSGATIKFIGKEFKDGLGVEWTDGTAIVHCKILLDWTRKCNKAPKIFIRNRNKKQV